MGFNSGFKGLNNPRIKWMIFVFPTKQEEGLWERREAEGGMV